MVPVWHAIILIIVFAIAGVWFGLCRGDSNRYERERLIRERHAKVLEREIKCVIDAFGPGPTPRPPTKLLVEAMRLLERRANLKRDCSAELFEWYARHEQSQTRTDAATKGASVACSCMTDVERKLCEIAMRVTHQDHLSHSPYEPDCTVCEFLKAAAVLKAERKPAPLYGVRMVHTAIEVFKRRNDGNVTMIAVCPDIADAERIVAALNAGAGK